MNLRKLKHTIAEEISRLEEAESTRWIKKMKGKIRRPLGEQGPRPSQINKAEAQRAYDHLLNNDYDMPKGIWQYAIWGLVLLLEGDSNPDTTTDSDDSGDL